MNNKIIILTGPTCIGKTKISLEIAKKYNCEIINIDSTQFYKNMDVGTNKLNVKDQKNIKHHMMSFLNVDENYSIYNYKQDVDKILKKIFKKSKIPLFVGSSGLYISSITKKYFFYKERDKKIENKYASFSNEKLYDLLYKIDPSSAKALNTGARRKILRALDIYYENGKTKSELNKKEAQKELPYKSLILCLYTTNKEFYYENIYKRIIFEINNGFVEETKNIVKQYPLFRIYNSFNIMGYKDIINYIDNNISREELINNLYSKTKKLSKKQITFYRNKLLDSKWINVFDKDYNNYMYKLIDDFLNIK